MNILILHGDFASKKDDFNIKKDIDHKSLENALFFENKKLIEREIFALHHHKHSNPHKTEKTIFYSPTFI